MPVNLILTNFLKTTGAGISNKCWGLPKSGQVRTRQEGGTKLHSEDFVDVVDVWPLVPRPARQQQEPRRRPRRRRCRGPAPVQRILIRHVLVCVIVC